MKQPTLPHYPHHRREMLLTHRRFSLGLLSIFVAISVIAGLQYRGSYASTSVTLNAVADAYADDFHKSTNNGSDADLWGGVDHIAYMKFDLSSLAGKTIVSANLQMNETLTQSGASVGYISNTSWGEN